MRDKLPLLRILALIAAAAFVVFLMLTLTGCHGTQGMAEYELPVLSTAERRSFE